MSVWHLTQRFGAAVATRGRRALSEQILGLDLLRQTFGEPVPHGLLVQPRSLHRASVRLGMAILDGLWILPGGRVNAHEPSPFFAEPPNELWAESAHGFAWLAHLEAVGSQEAEHRARTAAAHWLRAFSNYDAVGWRPHVMGRRLLSWLTYGRFITAHAEPAFATQFMVSLVRQAQHLARSAASAPEGLPRLTAAAAVTMSGLCLPGGERRITAGAHAMAAELDRQILPDGAHISRSPEQLAVAMADTLMVAGAFRTRDIALPFAIRRALDRMAPAIRFFCHGDGRFALFNGGTEGPEAWAAQLLANDDAHGAPLGHASHVGFQRLSAGDCLVLCDTGLPPPPACSAFAHAGTLSFEFSYGVERIIVNCGAVPLRDGAWQHACRATAAHSTVTVNDHSSAQFLTQGMAQRVLGAQLLPGPTEVPCRRIDDEDGTTIAASHDGYVQGFGLKHHRSLFLAAAGNEVRGQDVISTRARPLGSAAVPFCARFHLHPDVSVSAEDSGYRLRLASGDAWHFSAEGGTPALGESIYAGDGETLRPTQQIELHSAVESGAEALLQWVLRRVA
ncbi:MAG TPA: heparinase [Alphaproteobacteria bacterium]|nr:heparinase [Alphaproteobacteria bacterium]HAJ46858.1 heparinase [Alphaproteobacteria bacterium]